MSEVIRFLGYIQHCPHPSELLGIGRLEALRWCDAARPLWNRKAPFSGSQTKVSHSSDFWRNVFWSEVPTRNMSHAALLVGRLQPGQNQRVKRNSRMHYFIKTALAAGLLAGSTLAAFAQSSSTVGTGGSSAGGGTSSSTVGTGGSSAGGNCDPKTSDCQSGSSSTLGTGGSSAGGGTSSSSVGTGGSSAGGGSSSSSVGTGGSTAGSGDGSSSSTTGTGASQSGETTGSVQGDDNSARDSAQDDESNKNCPPGLAKKDGSQGKKSC